MTAGVYDITVEQGADFVMSAKWASTATPTVPSAPYDVTGYTAKMQFRSTFGASSAYLTASTGNGAITVDGPNGTFNIHLQGTITAAFAWTTGVYDIDIVAPDGFVTRLLQGTVTVSPAVTDMSNIASWGEGMTSVSRSYLYALDTIL